MTDARQPKKGEKMPAPMTETQVVRHNVDLSAIPCPSCSRADRWDAMDTMTNPHNNPELIVFCDCGAGQLRIVVE